MGTLAASQISKNRMTAIFLHAGKNTLWSEPANTDCTSAFWQMSYDCTTDGLLTTQFSPAELIAGASATATRRVKPSGFIKDPILFDGGDTNLYGYVLGDPVNGVDWDGREIQNPGNYPINSDIMEQLEDFNEYIGRDKDIVITGGNRTSNSSLGSGSNSQHVVGSAVDFVVPGQTHLESANDAKDSGLFGGVGWYEEGYRGSNGEGPHVHVDLGRRREWGYDKDGNYGAIPPRPCP